MSTEATIPLADEIPLILMVVNAKTGNPVSNAHLSGVVWKMDNTIGQIVTDPNNPNLAIFQPSKPGVTNITATAEITIS